MVNTPAPYQLWRATFGWERLSGATDTVTATYRRRFSSLGETRPGIDVRLVPRPTIGQNSRGMRQIEPSGLQKVLRRDRLFDLRLELGPASRG